MDPRVAYNNLYSNCFLNPIEETQPQSVTQLVKMAKDFGNYMPTLLGAGWTLWLGPVEWAILANRKNDYAFLVTRVWWHRLYNNAALVEQQVVDEEATLGNIKATFERSKRLIKRYPIPGHEFIVPVSKLDIPLSRVAE